MAEAWGAAKAPSARAATAGRAVSPPADESIVEDMARPWLTLPGNARTLWDWACSGKDALNGVEFLFPRAGVPDAYDILMLSCQHLEILRDGSVLFAGDLMGCSRQSIATKVKDSPFACVVHICLSGPKVSYSEACSQAGRGSVDYHAHEFRFVEDWPPPRAWMRRGILEPVQLSIAVSPRRSRTPNREPGGHDVPRETRGRGRTPSPADHRWRSPTPHRPPQYPEVLIARPERLQAGEHGAGRLTPEAAPREVLAGTDSRMPSPSRSPPWARKVRLVERPAQVLYGAAAPAADVGQAGAPPGRRARRIQYLQNMIRRIESQNRQRDEELGLAPGTTASRFQDGRHQRQAAGGRGRGFGYRRR